MSFSYRESGDGYLAQLEYSQQRIETISGVGEKVGKKVGKKVGDKLTENQRTILECMQKNPSIAAKEISELIGISIRKTEENIKKLREQEFIKRVGPARGGHWEVSD